MWRAAFNVLEQFLLHQRSVPRSVVGEVNEYQILEVKFRPDAVVVTYMKTSDLTEHTMLQRRLAIMNVAYPELIQEICNNVALLIENIEEDAAGITGMGDFKPREVMDPNDEGDEDDD